MNILGRRASEGIKDRTMEKILEFILADMPLGTMVFDKKMERIYLDSTAGKFLQRYATPTLGDCFLAILLIKMCQQTGSFF